MQKYTAKRPTLTYENENSFKNNNADTTIFHKQSKKTYGKSLFSAAIRPLLLYATIFLLLYFPKPFSEAAFSALEVWAKFIAPTVFPFMIITRLTVHYDALSPFVKILEKLFKRLFGSGKDALYPFISGTLAGYPMGARLLGESCKNNPSLQQKAKTLVLLCINCGPVFLISTVGSGFLNNTTAGFIAFVSQISSAMIISAIYKALCSDKVFHSENNPKSNNSTQNSIAKSISQPTLDVQELILQSISATLAIAGYMIITYIAAEFLRFPFIPDWISTAGNYLLEITIACKTAAESFSLRTATALCAGISSFGGLCIIFQCLPYLRQCGISPFRFIIGKIICSLLSMIICFLLTGIFL